jgi:hypothetical protein
MALPATDAFTGVNNTALPTYSANWTANAGTLAIYDNSVAPYDSGAENAAHWNADAFDADQYAQVTLSETVSDAYAIGPGIRCAASGATYYLYYTSSAGRYLYVSDGGSLTELGSAGAVSVGVVMRLEANGTTITPKLDGVTDSTIGAVSNEALSSGYAGVTGYGANSDTRADSFEGGNLGGAVSYQPRPPVAIDSLMVF